MRVQIANHLKIRSKTIRATVNSLNRAALGLQPPREPLKYTTVIDMAFMAQFDLLQHSRRGFDARKMPWADPATRIITDQYFELARAKEEIKRLRVEWKRLRTWLVDERRLYMKVIDHLSSSPDLCLLDAVKRQWEHVEGIHQANWYWLGRCQALPSFSAPLSLGQAVRPEYMNIQLATSLNHPSGSDADLLNSDTVFPGGNAEFDRDDKINENALGLEECVDDHEEFDNLLSTIANITI